LFEILHFDWFNIPPIEIAKLSLESAETQFTQHKRSLRQILTERSTQPAKDLFTPAIEANLGKAAVAIEKLIAAVPNLTLQQLFEKIIREAGVLSIILKSDEKHWLLQVLSALFDFMKDETARNPSINLPQLVSMFDLMEKEGLAIPLVQVSGNDKGVNLLTTHGSKGLEFQHVYFAGCNAGVWEKKRNPNRGYAMPDTMFSSPTQAADNEELRRLFYVAITRAEEHLNISYSLYRSDGKHLEPSMFVEEIKEGQELQAEKIVVLPEVVAEFRAIQFGETLSPEMDRTEKEFIDRLLEKFTMNVTALNNYLKCPIEFYFKNLVRIPSPKNENTEFGSAVHFAVEKLFRKMQDSGKEQFPSKKEFISDFEWYMKRHRESFTREQFSRRMEYGQVVLSEYYDTYLHSWNKIVSIERNIRGVVVNNVPLKGKLDKLEFTGKQVNVVDYKTGNPENARPKLMPPNDKDPNGGDYWRQAVFYKLLVEESQSNWTVMSCEFDFVEPDNKKVYRQHKIAITPADVETVKQQIGTVWNKIREHDFYNGCGKNDCHWCNFVKTNNMAIALHEAESEDE
jgi:DNA helicase-2/ATP-dependent DNA helicase PcrA